MATLEQLENRVLKIENNINGITIQVDKLTKVINSKLNLSDLERNINELRSLISDNSRLISDIENRLSKVILPEETRYYLKEGEVSSFQSNFNALKSMMVQFDKLYKNLIAYQVNFTTNN